MDLNLALRALREHKTLFIISSVIALAFLFFGPTEKSFAPVYSSYAKILLTPPTVVAYSGQAAGTPVVQSSFRLDQSSQNRQVLDTLHRIREQSQNPETGAGDKSTPAPLDPQSWNAQWNRKDDRASRPGDKFGNTVREIDVLKRAQLERRYEDNLLIYRSLLLQHSFLKTWESLETDKLEIVDPVVVHGAPRVDATWAALGGLAGAILWFLLRLTSTRE